MQRRSTTEIQHCLDRLLAGEQPARDLVIQYAYERLRILTRKFSADFPGIAEWEQTDDVLHKAAIRLWKSLEDVQPDNVRKFFALASLQIRRELIDTSRRYCKPCGHDARARNMGVISDETGAAQPEKVDPTDGPPTLSEWTELHATVHKLPDDQREVFDLLYYHGLTQPQAAEVLGVSLSTLKRRWLGARQSIYRLLREMPGDA